jgi:flagellar hook-associated protein 3 FlgL
MRITNSLFYTNSGNDYQKNMQELYKVNTQISSGMKIQNSFEDSGVYVDTMRLDYEIATLEQVEESSSKAQTYANNTDKTLNQFTDALNQFKTKLVQSANGSHSETSLNALANELEALKNHMISLGNTSINGQYLFSGTAVTTKPLDSNGNYHGNDESVEALIGSGVKLPYNISGKELFLGEDGDYSKVISTNVKMLNQTKLHPEVMQGLEKDSFEEYLTSNDTIRDMVGDTDSDISNDPNTVFYLSGRKADGETFSEKFDMSSSSKIEDLLERIGEEYGNTSTNKVVEVSMNAHGQIEVKDLKKGNSLLEMSLFGAVDRDAAAGTVGNADKNIIDNLLSEKNVDIIEFSKSNFKTLNTASTVGVSKDIYSDNSFKLNTKFLNTDATEVEDDDTLQSFMGSDVDRLVISGTNTDGTSVASYVFNVSSTTTVQDLLTDIETHYTNVSARIENGQIIIDDNSGTTPSSFDLTMISRDNTGTNVNGFATLDGMNYERRSFEKDGNQLSSNVFQIVKDTNEYATNSTKLSEVAGASLDGSSLELEYVDILGNQNSATINFATTGSTFSVNGTTYDIYNSSGTITTANDLTYQQLSDIVAMLVSDKLPTDSDSSGTIEFSEYNKAIEDSRGSVEAGLDYKGRFEIKDKLNSQTKIEFSMFDSNANNASTPSTLKFMANDLVVVEEPKIDFYKDLDEMIEAVRNGTFRMDANSDNPRNMGIQNSLQRLDHIMDHVTKEHTKIGSYSNALSQANERSQLLSVNVQTVRSEVIDVDIGEAYMKFNQLSNSYQAMLSTVAKINSMSLLNYM